jgi:uncharacterized membrane protein YebE (DUF533 family)
MNAMDILGGLLGANSPVQSSGRRSPLEDLLGGALNSRQAQAAPSPAEPAPDEGGMSLGKKAIIGVLGGIAAAAFMRHMRRSSAANETPQAGSDAGKVDMSDIAGFGGTETDANDQAQLLITAMLNGAKADGRIDSKEEEKILAQLGDVGKEEQEFLRAQLRAPVDANALARAVPAGMKSEVYAMSLLGIELDDRKEAQYLLDLAKALGLSGAECTRIHKQLGAPEICDA